jgi:hypothetical protein
LSETNEVVQDTSAAQRAAGKEAEQQRGLVWAMCALATLHLAWFYTLRVPTYLDIVKYENGRERMPFQGRMLMEYPLRWAHSSAFCIGFAKWLSSFHMWLKDGLPPEFILDEIVGVACLTVAGLVARDLYRKHSRSGRFLPFVYPLVLVMAAVMYCLPTAHFFSFVYDLPSLGLFAAGMWAIARRSNVLILAAIFAAATVNRETSIFLALFYLLSAGIEGERFSLKRALRWKPLLVSVALGMFWIGWHVWVTRHFTGHDSEKGFHLGLNLLVMVWPLDWPQLFGIAAYSLPMLLLFRAGRRPLELRLWLWALPLWLLFMMIFGIVFEIRLFGELIPLFACVAALMLDERFAGSETAGSLAEIEATLP